MCLPRIRVNIDLDEDRNEEYFTSSTSYSRKQSSYPASPSTRSTSQLRGRQHLSSYDYATTASTRDFQERYSLRQRDKPRLDYRTTSSELRESPRDTRDREFSHRSRQQLPAQTAYYPSSRSYLRTAESKDPGRHVKSVEQRVIADNLVELIEIAPKGSRGSSRRDKRYISYPEWRSESDR